ncbi:hypothetical protein PS9374_05182 [Planomonospora sphaerica]|uniref:Lipoprotein n=1 Tax=Planomonospora sphaerica TaxID=161355 RepID=A0A161LL52_9ACTN|nr:hypothetical protein [Planomonospora sphaerica]GAT69507.1 hypothetical protein PS9374_05182 [Planomonospora sphaerica]
MRSCTRRSLLTRYLPALLVTGAGAAACGSDGRRIPPAARTAGGTAGGTAAPQAVTAILARFASHRIVTIGDFHGLAQLGDFYRTLVASPAFPDRCRNIVVEFGNAHYQGLVDRYVSGGEVDAGELAKVWTTTVGFGDQPMPEMYGRFYTAVRRANAGLPPRRRLRVWLGDPPNDPASPLRTPPERDRHFAGVVTAVADRGETVLAIMGDFHLMPGGFPFPEPGEPGGPITRTDGDASPFPQRSGGNGDAPPPPPAPGRNVRQLLDARHPGRTYAVRVHNGLAEPDCNRRLEAHLASWPAPGMRSLGEDRELAAILRDGNCHDLMVAFPKFDKAWADGYLYLGPVDALSMSPVPGKRPMTLREFIERAREDFSGDGPQGSGPGPARITAP